MFLVWMAIVRKPLSICIMTVSISVAFLKNNLLKNHGFIEKISMKPNIN